MLTLLKFLGVCPVVPARDKLLEVIKRLAAQPEDTVRAKLLEPVDHRLAIRVSLDDDDGELGLPCQITQKQPLSLAHALPFTLPLTDKKLALALKNHVDIAGRRLWVGLNQSFELKEVNVRRVGVVHQLHVRTGCRHPCRRSHCPVGPLWRAQERLNCRRVPATQGTCQSSP